MAIARWGIRFLIALAGVVGSSRPQQPVVPPDPQQPLRVVLVQDSTERTEPTPHDCEGYAAGAVPCQPLVLHLENQGSEPIRFAFRTCAGLDVRFQSRSAPSAPWRQSTEYQYPSVCPDATTPADWTSIELPPGGKQSYGLRMVGGERKFSTDHWLATPSSLEIRASVSINRLSAGQGRTQPMAGGATRYFPPFEGSSIVVTSNPVLLAAKPSQPFPAMRLDLQLGDATGVTSPGLEQRDRRDCGSAADSAACKPMHFRVRNLTDHTVLLYRSNCQPDGPWPEFEAPNGGWIDIKPGGSTCFRNFMYPVVVRSGESLEDDFQLIALFGNLDLAQMKPAADYRLRIKLTPTGCDASPDGMFCLDNVRALPELTSDPWTVHATAEGPP